MLGATAFFEIGDRNFGPGTVQSTGCFRSQSLTAASDECRLSFKSEGNHRCG